MWCICFNCGWWIWDSSYDSAERLTCESSQHPCGVDILDNQFWVCFFFIRFIIANSCGVYIGALDRPEPVINFPLEFPLWCWHWNWIRCPSFCLLSFVIYKKKCVCATVWVGDSDSPHLLNILVRDLEHLDLSIGVVASTAVCLFIFKTHREVVTASSFLVSTSHWVKLAFLQSNPFWNGHMALVISVWHVNLSPVGVPISAGNFSPNWLHWIFCIPWCQIQI